MVLASNCRLHAYFHCKFHENISLFHHECIHLCWTRSYNFLSKLDDQTPILFGQHLSLNSEILEVLSFYYSYNYTRNSKWYVEILDLSRVLDTLCVMRMCHFPCCR